MGHDERVRDLRALVRARLRQVIGRPEIEAKELAAFDLLMSRREFLRKSQYTAMAGLIAAGMPPTLWGRRDPELAVDPADVGLTVGDQASATAATQVTVGTELFEETVYAQPVVSPEAVHSHAVIEGARPSLRTQSDLEADGPAEATFLDTRGHWGRPELVQLENTAENGWELVHYRHPWGPREDGAQTDGYVRDVIIGPNTVGGRLVNPVGVTAITGPHSNLYAPGGTAGEQVSGVSYLIVVEESGGTEHHMCLGVGAWTAGASPASEPYPVQWDVVGIYDAVDTYDGNFLSAVDKYTTSGFPLAQAYDAARATEHIVLYFQDGVRFVTLVDDAADPGAAPVGVLVTTCPFPLENNQLVTDLGVVDLSWQPPGNLQDVAPYDGVSLQTQTFDSSDDVVFLQEYPYEARSSVTPGTAYVGARGRQLLSELGLRNPDGSFGGFLKYAPSLPQPDFTRIRDVHELYTVSVADGGTWTVKLGRVVDAGLYLFVTAGGVEGYFPLAMPDAAGVGKIATLSGGTSKFGGCRFTASDADGNVFLLRQQRLTAQDSPYASPIYAQYDATGAERARYPTTSTGDPLPSTVSSTSNLHQLQHYAPPVTTRFEVGNIVVRVPANLWNVLLNAALAFGTDVTYAAEAVWLGDGFQAAYALKRFSQDSEHIEVKRAQGSATEYSAYLAFVNPVTKTWHTRQIASQTLPKAPGLNESGDHYQATVAGANAYGRPVSLTTSDNADLLIEVRADAPTTVIDGTHNLYYDIDRYTSFMAAPDPNTGRLELLVKAETFAQVIYLRLVDTSGLQPSEGDSAMLSSSGVTTYPWQTLNMAAQAQQRMGNDGTAAVLDLLGDAAPLADTKQYISGPDLYNNGGAGDWTYKSGFGPPSSPTDTNLASLGTYLNTSGQNLTAATPQLGLGASPDGQTIDPLTAVTALSAVSLVAGAVGTTTFTYPAGAIGHAATVAGAGDEVGSIWSGISYDLQDALRWLQNVAADVYKDFKEGAVAVEMAAGSITCTVSADIMQAVNGVDQALTEVVSTVEAYANVLANLVVTIVEQSFLYKLIELLVALISLFAHLKDIQELSDSLTSTFTNEIGEKTLPGSIFNSWNQAQQYFGPDQQMTAALGVDPSSAPTTQSTGPLDSVSGNPLTKKILNTILSAITQQITGALSSPVTFTFDLSPQILDQLEALETDVEDAIIDVTDGIVTTFVNQVAEDLANPQQTFTNFRDGIGSIVEVIEQSAEQLFDAVDGFIVTPPPGQPAGTDAVFTQTVTGLLGQDLITIDLQVLADLCKLFGIGEVGGSKLTLSAVEAVFFPMALIIWVAVYTDTGTSINSVDALEPSAGAEPGDSGAQVWDIARLAVDLVLTELTGLSWLARARADEDDDPSAGEEVLQASGPYLNVIRWANDLLYGMQVTWDSAGDVDRAFPIARLTTSMFRLGAYIEDKPTAGRVAEVLATLYTLFQAGWDTVKVVNAQSPTAQQIVAIIGQDLTRLRIVVTTLGKPAADSTVIAVVVVALPFGFVLQMPGFPAVSDPPPERDRPGTDNPKRQGPPPGRPRRGRPASPPGLERRGAGPRGRMTR